MFALSQLLQQLLSLNFFMIGSSFPHVVHIVYGGNKCNTCNKSKIKKQYIFLGEELILFSLNMCTYAFISLRTTKRVLHHAELHPFTFSTNQKCPTVSARMREMQFYILSDPFHHNQLVGWFVSWISQNYWRGFHQKEETSVWGEERCSFYKLSNSLVFSFLVLNI